MKKNFLIITFLVLIATNLFAQVPEAVSYQAIVRDANGQILSNANVSLRISILTGNTNGDAVYVENHQVTTNDFGLINLRIGEGAPELGDFSQIEWAENTHFTKIELDIEGGNNYMEIGTSQILSVPYALQAKKAESVDFSQITDVPLEISPRIAAKGQSVSVTFSGGDAVEFSQGSNTCPALWSSANLHYSQGTSTIQPIDVYFIDNERFDVIFSIPYYVPSGMYDIILAPNTPCQMTIEAFFKVK